jgi:hypothetical protein
VPASVVGLASNAVAPMSARGALSGKAGLMDIAFIVVILVLYGVTHWMASAISRLGGIE